MSVEAVGAIGVEPAAPVNPIVGGEPLWSYLENIIDKKVNNVSLNIFEKLVDFLSTHLYSSYNKRFEFKASQVNLNDPVEPKGLPAGVEYDLPKPSAAPAVHTIAGKVFEFQKGGNLYDQTATSRVNVKPHEVKNIITGEVTTLEDQIIIDGKPIVFSTDPKHMLEFGNKFGTKHVVVSEHAEFPELVSIFERTLDGKVSLWVVDTTKPVDKILKEGDLEIGSTKVLYAKHASGPGLLDHPSKIIENAG